MATLLITLRETLEASLIVGVMLAFLHRTQNREKNPVIWLGVAAGIMSSLVAAWFLLRLGASFSGRAEAIYEGTMMLAASALVLWMVVWLSRNGKNMQSAIERKMEVHLAAGALFSLFLLVYTSVLREGIETAIFLQAALLQSQSVSQHIGAITGMVLAIGIAWLLFRGMLRWFSLSKFFRYTGILLAIFAISLLAQGLQEFEEAGLLDFTM